MSTESDPDKGTAQNEDKNENPEVKVPATEKKQKDPEVLRMQAALKKIQEEKAELEKYKTETERSKLSEAERVKAEAEDLKKEKEKLARELAVKEVELKLRDQVDSLVDAGLDGREFGKKVLGFWKEDEETLDEFIVRAKEDKKLKKFFASEEIVERPKAPASPGTSTNRGNKVAEATAEEKAWAQRQYPNSPELQKRVLENLKKARVTRAAEEAE